MRILGIDPGTVRMGYGVVQSEGSGPACLDWGVLTVQKSLPLPERLHCLQSSLVALIQQWEPDEFAIEEPFVAKNVRSALTLGQAQGVALVAAAGQGLQVHRYSPTQIKKAVADYGASSKQQVQGMVRLLLALEEVPSTDAADALAVGLCHLRYRSANLLIGRGYRL